MNTDKVSGLAIKLLDAVNGLIRHLNEGRRSPVVNSILEIHEIIRELLFTVG